MTSNSTVFTNYQTIVLAPWMNDVNNFVYSGTLPSGATFSPLVNQLIYSNGTSLTGLATVNNGVLTTSAAGVIQWLTSANNKILTTSASGVPQWTSSGSLPFTLNVVDGGTGAITFNAYGVIVGGITSTGSLQSISNPSTANLIFMSGGTGVVPLWSTATYPVTAGTSSTLLSSNGTGFVNTTATYPTASPSNGQVLIGNNTGFVSATITQGNGITIINGSGTITIRQTYDSYTISQCGAP